MRNSEHGLESRAPRSALLTLVTRQALETNPSDCKMELIWFHLNGWLKIKHDPEQEDMASI